MAGKWCKAEPSLKPVMSGDKWDEAVDWITISLAEQKDVEDSVGSPDWAGRYWELSRPALAPAEQRYKSDKKNMS